MKRLIQLTTLTALLATLTACSDDKHVLATVNGVEITQEQFDAYLQLKRIPADDEKRREKALEEFLKREGLAATIEKEGKLDSATIAAEVNEFRKEMIISRYFDQFLTEQVDEEQVQDSYGSDAAKYENKKVHVAHILVRTNKRMSEEQRQAKLTTAQEIHSKLQAGEDFEELAKQFSEDKISGRRGGDLGWIKEGTVDERFSQRAFELKAGTVTEPFETPFGFHILKVIEEAKTVRRPLGAVAGEIRYKLRNEAKSKELERLEGTVKVEKKKSYDPKLTPKKKAEGEAPKSSAKSPLGDPSKSGSAPLKAPQKLPVPPASAPQTPDGLEEESEAAVPDAPAPKTPAPKAPAPEKAPAPKKAPAAPAPATPPAAAPAAPAPTPPVAPVAP